MKNIKERKVGEWRVENLKMIERKGGERIPYSVASSTNVLYL